MPAVLRMLPFAGSTVLASVRSRRSAKVRFRESHNGHSHPTHRLAVSKRWATSRSSSRAMPAGAPDRVTTRMPSNARPRLQPVRTGSNHLLTTVAMKVNTTTTTYTHHNQLHCDVVRPSSHIVAITATP